MHILQQTVRRLVHGESEIGQEPVIPRRLEVAHPQIAPHQRLLQIVAQEDMQVVLHLVRLGPMNPSCTRFTAR